MGHHPLHLAVHGQVVALRPYVWLYCQNSEWQDHARLLPLTEHSRFGGRLVRLENVGRESHAYLVHITHHYGELAQHTLFSQDMPNFETLPRRFQVTHLLTQRRYAVTSPFKVPCTSG